MFIGREKELKILRDLLEKKSASAMIYGKRKIGKTTLIAEALKSDSNKTIYFECLKASLQVNVDNFVQVLVDLDIIPSFIGFRSFIDVFSYLNRQSETYNIVIDEYPYLKKNNDSDYIDSMFQNIIDTKLSNIRLFISGSHIGMMKDLLAEGNALFGRFNEIINLKELNYKEISAFYSNKSVYDKIGFYSVFGGSPFINESIKPTLSLKENIIKTILNPNSIVYIYADSLLLSDLFAQSNVESILYAIANGHKKYSEIQSKLNMSGNGLLNKQMRHLLDMELVSKTAPINKLHDNKKIRYEISDNVLRFFYTYVYENKSQLQILKAEQFYETYVAPTITNFISHRFEEMCRTYFALQAQAGKYPDIRNIGTYYYDDSVNKKNGEFDVVLEHADSYAIYEVKYHKNKLAEKDMIEEEKQVNAIPSLKVSRLGFISANGFDTKPTKYDCIDGNALYE